MPKFEVGCRVRLLRFYGPKKKFNGCEGEVVGTYVVKRGVTRWPVKLDQTGDIKRIKPENLVKIRLRKTPRRSSELSAKAKRKEAENKKQRNASEDFDILPLIEVPGLEKIGENKSVLEEETVRTFCRISGLFLASYHNAFHARRHKRDPSIPKLPFDLLNEKTSKRGPAKSSAKPNRARTEPTLLLQPIELDFHATSKSAPSTPASSKKTNAIIIRLREEKLELEKKIKELKSGHEEKTKKLGTMQEEIELLKTRLNGTEEKRMVAERQVEKQRKQENELKTRNLELKYKNENLEKLFEQSITERMDPESPRDKVDAVAEDLKTRLKQERIMRQEYQQKFENLEESSKMKISALTSQVDMLEEELQRFREEVRNLQGHASPIKGLTSPGNESVDFDALISEAQTMVNEMDATPEKTKPSVADLGVHATRKSANDIDSYIYGMFGTPKSKSPRDFLVPTESENQENQPAEDIVRYITNMVGEDKSEDVLKKVEETTTIPAVNQVE